MSGTRATDFPSMTYIYTNYIVRIICRYVHIPRGDAITSRDRVHFGQGRGEGREAGRGTGPVRLRQFPTLRSRRPYRPVWRSPDALLVDLSFLRKNATLIRYTRRQ